MAANTAVPSDDLKAPVLNSWKEIATYLGRGVRTVQRYERELHLPVRRVGGRSRKSVIALSRDLDAWLQHATIQSLQDPSLRSSTNNFIAQSCELRRQCAQLRAEHANAIALLRQNLYQIVQQFAAHTNFRQLDPPRGGESESVATMPKAS